ncbi:hypothetical protein IFR05_002090, partial [Cadophora sp. M221]
PRPIITLKEMPPSSPNLDVAKRAYNIGGRLPNARRTYSKGSSTIEDVPATEGDNQSVPGIRIGNNPSTRF